MQMALFPDPRALADELGELRAEIKRLKAREAELRQALIETRPNGPVDGSRYRVTIRESRRRTIDIRRLPEAIRSDDRYWKVSTTRTVVTRVRADTDPPDDDIELFEEF